MTNRSVTIHIRPDLLAISPEQAARYAGGSRYRMDPEMKRLASAGVAHGKLLATPAFVYAVHQVHSFDPKEGVSLETGDFIKLPYQASGEEQGASGEEQGANGEGQGASGEGYPTKRSIAHHRSPIALLTAVCTLGPELEQQAARLSSQGHALESLFLGAVGVAMLEMLAEKAHEHLDEQGEKSGFHTGCRFGPGYGEMPMDVQKVLFELTDTTHIGVRLNENYVMAPVKSLSFFTEWHTSPRFSKTPYKCQSCGLKNCAYRQ